MNSFPFYKQLDRMDCGPTCLRMIAKFHGKNYSLQNLREKSFLTREGVSLLGISNAAEKIGMHTIGATITYEKLEKEVPLPCIVHWNQNHFIVVIKIKKNVIHVADPAYGILKLTKKEFFEGWLNHNQKEKSKGICLLLEPTPEFYIQESEKINKTNFKFLFSYLRPYKKFLFQLFLGLLFSSFLQLLFPFLTQSIVDFGINNHNINFIYLVLIAQLVLFISRMSVDFIRSWILLHISTRINISLISDFLIKLMKLPIGFFDTKMTGDIMQRIGDHQRIESFLTSSTLSIIFSIVNLFVFSIVLAIYSLKILVVFLIGSSLYVLWIMLFMKKRRELDYSRFSQMSEKQSNIIQLISGIQEIKLNNCEKQKRWEWENIQAKIFRINMKGLSLSQYQNAGSVFINESKNIIVTFLTAIAVINGEMTLGMMIAVQYIIGQLNGPIGQMIGFLHATQDAKISLERLGEIHNKEDEETSNNKLTTIPEDKTIKISNLSFHYDPLSGVVLENIDLIIPKGKITALVGTSGSGKTTLLKLLLGFYSITKGEIKIEEVDLSNINSHLWRSQCGVVMQDGFIFSDTIMNNITVSDEKIDKLKLLNAVKIANIKEFIESLPLGYKTKIGAEGNGLSQGQKQRILIARAIYKNPEYIFFDEATNALDADNEKIIMENLEQFFKDKTVIVVAHRLSTVKNADQIVVLEKGQIVEIGNHKQLTEKKNIYYNLVKNQLELGS